MAWIWSDELAAAAEADGLNHDEIAVWKRQPVAYPLGVDLPIAALARRLLGLETHDAKTDSSDPEPASISPCTCGNPDLAATLLSAPSRETAAGLSR